MSVTWLTFQSFNGWLKAEQPLNIPLMLVTFVRSGGLIPAAKVMFSQSLKKWSIVVHSTVPKSITSLRAFLTSEGPLIFILVTPSGPAVTVYSPDFTGVKA